MDLGVHLSNQDNLISRSFKDFFQIKDYSQVLGIWIWTYVLESQNLNCYTPSSESQTHVCPMQKNALSAFSYPPPHLLQQQL